MPCLGSARDTNLSEIQGSVRAAVCVGQAPVAMAGWRMWAGVSVGLRAAL